MFVGQWVPKFVHCRSIVVLGDIREGSAWIHEQVDHSSQTSPMGGLVNGAMRWDALVIQHERVERDTPGVFAIGSLVR